MNTFSVKGSNANDIFCDLLKGITLFGGVSFPRGFAIKEVINCHVELTNPRDRNITVPKRKFDEAYALGELVWYLSGSDELKPMTYYSKNLSRFSDDGLTLNSAYGKRIFGYHDDIGFNQWDLCKKRLQEDKCTRQAIIHIHTPSEKVTKDEVCTMYLQFFIRDEKLHLICNMRSNDLIYGFCYDMYNFTMLQEIMANELGIDVGSYFHNAGSMHVYGNGYYKNLPNFITDCAEIIEEKRIKPQIIKCNSTMEDVGLLQEIEESYRSISPSLLTPLNKVAIVNDICDKSIFWNNLLKDDWLLHVSQMFARKAFIKIGVLGVLNNNG